MKKKSAHQPAPVPPANRPNPPGAHGPGKNIDAQDLASETTPDTGTGFQEQDPKRRLGGFTGAGEHSIQQPRELNDR